nr:immunoglobulin heavy chain junction region [Mus musculus]
TVQDRELGELWTT